MDENDNPPYFTQSSYVGHISEAAAVNSVVLMEDNTPLVISAKDKDSDQNANLVFTILEEEARKYFAIDSSTGRVTRGSSVGRNSCRRKMYYLLDKYE